MFNTRKDQDPIYHFYDSAIGNNQVFFFFVSYVKLKCITYKRALTAKQKYFHVDTQCLCKYSFLTLRYFINLVTVDIVIDTIINL